MLARRCEYQRLLLEQQKQEDERLYENLHEKTGRLLAASIVSTLMLTPGTARADAVLDWNAIMQSDGERSGAVHSGAFRRDYATGGVRGGERYYPGIQAVPGHDHSAGGRIGRCGGDCRGAQRPEELLSCQCRGTGRLAGGSLAAIPDGTAKTAGIAVGEAAAAAVMAARSNDGATPALFYLPTSSAAGEWQTTAGCTAAGGTFYHWRNLTPFGIRSAAQFQLDEPPALKSARYARDYNEVQSMGATNSTLRPQDRTDVARYFAVTSPVAIWNPVARQLSVAAADSLSQNARVFALLNMAMSDAAVATFDTKYKYKTWRPETAIHMGQADGNDATAADGAFTPLITAPCFPGYPSAHATLSNAAREMLERIYAPRRRALILSNPAVPGITLRYTRLKEITEDIDDARVYGGIHFRFEQEAGADLGRRVGEYLYKSLMGSAGTCSCEGR